MDPARALTPVECDRSFTRSDALLKHMRTQHETEALRQAADAGARGFSTANSKPQRLKLIVKPNGVHSNGTAAAGDDHIAAPDDDHEFLLQLGLSEEELHQPSDKLYRMLYHYLRWAEEVNERYKAECKELEARHRYEWEYKELVFLNMMESELAVAEKKVSPEDRAAIGTVRAELLPKTPLPLSGQIWFRKEA